MPELPKTKPPLMPPKRKAKTGERGYGHAHQQLRKARIEAHPLCELCGSRLSEHLHHIDRNTFNTEPTNLQALCKLCHRRLHSA